MLIPLTLALASLLEGETCPSPADVERRVRAILRLGEEQALTERFIVERREAGLFVELRAETSALIGERVLPPDSSCEELAQAAAVVLSAWLSDVHPDFAQELPVAEVPLPEPVRTPEPSQPEPSSVVEPRPRDILPEPRVRPARPTHRAQLDAGLGLGVADGEPAWGGSLSAAWLPTRGLGARASVLLDATRQAALGVEGGFVTWRRWPLSLGPAWRFSSKALSLDVTAAPALSWLRVRGDGFEPSKTQSGFTWAVTGDARLASRGSLGWFLAAHGQAYLAESSVYAGDAERALPRLVLSLLVGARVTPF